MGASQNFNISLNINANAQSAEKQLQNLQKQLQQISSMKVDVGVGNLAADIEQASQAAMKLSAHLATATNPQTGNLDFTKFYSSIQKSGASLEQYGAALQKMGPAGQKAFVSLADSISKSEIPLKRTSKMVDKMWDGLKRTAGWQLQSSIIHGVVGGVQRAVGYAKDLNKSLTDIRIVTGQSTDQMAKFAREANKAAKNLSTTTTDYTRASLIYYQQGLSDAEVKARTETTIKMANATGTSAQKVSDQMTAIWNNYDNGTKSLTHYADVMTALGAATASSTDEIAQGLQKFASISNTVGLSYEYAASALATITAESRESADVVGNALKTLFSRIQGLQLGETLDDGTTLNKYSTALAKVGISIKDQAGELKDMDDILNEMGTKWDTLARDEKMALAQTVAGVRQYTQLMTLMENWDDFKQNLNIANTSAGTLDAQAAIYAESWEAASDRVRASWEGLWDNLINSEGFIAALDIASGFIDLFDNLITGIGGAGGALATFGGILTRVFNKQIASTISDVSYFIRMLNPNEVEAMKQKQINFVNQAKAAMSQDYINPLYGPYESKSRRDSMSSSLDASLAFLENRDHMNAEQLLLESMFADQAREVQQQKIDAGRVLDQAHAATADAFFKLYSDQENMSGHYLQHSDFYTSADGKNFEQIIQEAVKSQRKKLIDEQLELLDQPTPEANQRFNEIEAQIPQLETQMRQQYTSSARYDAELKGRAGKLTELYQKFNDIFKANGTKNTQDTISSLEHLITSLGDPSNSEAIRTLGNSEFFTNLAKGLAGLEIITDENGNQTLSAESSKYLAEQMAQFQGFNAMSMAGLADQITKRIQNSGNFTGDAGELQVQIRELAQRYLAENYALNGYEGINVKPFDPNDLSDPRVQNMQKQQTQNKAEAAVAGAQGIAQTLAAVESFKALGHQIEGIGNGTASLASVLSGIAGLSLNAASGFQGLHMALSQLTKLTPKGATGWSLGIMAALTAVSLAFEAFDYFTTSATEYATSIAKSTQNLQNAATQAVEAYEQSQQDSETHLANVRKIESYSQDPSEMANAIYEANKQAIDMITKYGQNWTENNEYTVDQNTGLIKIKESTLDSVQKEKENASEDFERVANLAQATQQMESAINNFTDGVQLPKEHFLDFVIPMYEEYLSGSEEGRKNWESFLSGYNGELNYDDIIAESAKNYVNGLRSIGLISQQNAGKILQEQGYSYQDTQGYKFLQEQASDIYQKEYLEKINSYDDLIGGKNGWIDQMDPKAIEMAKKYLEAQGHSGVEGLKYRNGELKYYSDDTSGEQSIEWEDVKRWQAEQEAEKAITGIGADGKSWLDKQIEITQSLYEEQGKGAEAILSYGEFGNLNQVSIEALKAADNISTASDKITTALKGKAFEDFTKAVDKALEPVDTFESLFKNLGETTIDYGSLSAESLQHLNNNINDFIGEESLQEAQKWLSGNWESEGTDTNEDGKKTFEDMSAEAQNLVGYTEGIEQMLQSSGLDAEGMAQAFNQIAQLDWTDDAGTNLRNIVATINNLGGDIDIANWDSLRGIMQDLSGTMPDYSGTIAQLTQIQQILNSLKTGDSITAEINVLLKMMGINTISDGKGGFIVTASQEEIDDAASSNQGEINDKVTAQRQTHSAYQDYKNTAGGNARTTTFDSYEDMVAYMSNPENAAFTDFIETAGGESYSRAVNNAAANSAAPWWQRLGTLLSGDAEQIAAMMNSDLEAESAQQGVVDLVNGMIETGKEGVSTNDIQSLAATYEDAAGLMEAINSENSAFRNEDGLVDSGTMEYLQTLPETSERATAAVDAFVRAETNLQKLKESGASQDDIDRAQAISDEAAAYAELQTTIDAVAAARGLDADVLAQQTAALQQTGEYSDATTDSLITVAAEILEHQQAIDALSKGYSDLSSTIRSGKKDSTEWAQTMAKMKKLLAGVLNIKDWNQLSDAFILAAESSGLLAKAAKGDKDAIADLAEYSLLAGEAIENGLVTETDLAAKGFAALDSKVAELANKTDLTGPEQAFLDFANNVNTALDGIKALDVGEIIPDGELHNAVGSALQAMDGFSGGLEGLANAASQFGLTPILEAVDVNNEAAVAALEGQQVATQTGENSFEVTSNFNPANFSASSGATLYKIRYAKTGGGGSAPSGGGGGGGGGPKKVANKRKSQTVKRYKKPDFKRERAQSFKKSAEKSKDYLYGESKIAQMEKINKLAEKEAHITSDRIKESQKYLKEDRENLIKVMQKWGYEATFDEDGFLTSYEEAWTKVHEKIAKLYEDNELTDDEQKLEEDYKVELEELEGALEDYENSLKELQADIEAYEESLYEMYDNKVEQMQHKVEFRIELNEDDLSYLDFWIEALGDSLYNALESLQTMGQKTDILFNGINTYKEGIEDIYALSDDPLHTWATGGLDEVLTQDQVDALRENRDGLMDYMKQLLNLRDTMQDKVLDTFDKWQEKLNATLSTIEHYGSVMEHFRNIIDIVGKDVLGLSDRFMSNLTQSAVDQSMDNIEATKAHYDSLVEQNATAQQALEDARARGDQSSVEHWEKVVQTTTEEMQSAQDALLSSLENTLTMIADQFEQAMTQAVEAFNDAIYAHGGLAGLQEDYSLIREQADLMAEDYDKIYQLSKLNRNINKTLNDSNIIAGKQKMKSLQQEINELQASGVELSKYDLDYLQAKYELRLAELELENAKNNKDTVRLSKDSEGNWSYVYTTSMDKVDEAQQKYEDALYAMQNLSYEYMEEMSAGMMNTSLAMMEEIQALRIQDFNSYEEYSAEVQRIQDKYRNYLSMQQDELNKSVTNNEDLYNKDWQSYSAMTGYKISANQDWADNYSETTLGMLLGSSSTSADFADNILNLSSILINDLGGSAITYFANVETAMNKYGSSISGFGSTVTTTVNNISTKSKTAAEDMKSMAADMNKSFADITAAVTAWQTEFSKQIDDMLTEIGDLIKNINLAIQQSANLTGDSRGSASLIGTDEAVSEINKIGKWGELSRNEDGSINIKGFNRDIDGDDKVDNDVNGTTIVAINAALIREIDEMMRVYFNLRSDSPERTALGEQLKQMFKDYHEFRDIVSRIYDITDLQSPTYAEPASMDTGGYTGEWGSSGKLAMLHEKELVLNANDTANFLDALNISRDVINRMIEMNAMQSSLGFGNLEPAALRDFAQNLEQQVSITAEFPNAIDHNEIEEAFGNLINQASQYAHRYK